MYVGSDGKLHFVDKAGADTVLNFNPVIFGSLTFNVKASWSGGSVTFGNSFSDAPTVLMMSNGASAYGDAVIVSNVTTTGFNYSVRAITNTDHNGAILSWCAFD